MTEELRHRSERLRIDRRTLLKSSVTITTATLASNGPLSEDEPVVSAQKVPLASEPILKVCANTSRRLLEIERRNELRRQAKLPLLPIAKELRVMKEAEDSERFSEAFGPFAQKRREAVWDEVLKTRRETEGPKWRPSWIEGMAHQSEVFRILRERFEAECKR